jgi:hypothetical protein
VLPGSAGCLRTLSPFTGTVTPASSGSVLLPEGPTLLTSADSRGCSASVAVDPDPSMDPRVNSAWVTAVEATLEVTPVEGSTARVPVRLTTAPHAFTPPHTPHESSNSGGVQHTPDGGRGAAHGTPRTSRAMQSPPHTPHGSTPRALWQHTPSRSTGTPSPQHSPVRVSMNPEQHVPSVSSTPSEQSTAPPELNRVPQSDPAYLSPRVGPTSCTSWRRGSHKHDRDMHPWQ